MQSTQGQTCITISTVQDVKVERKDLRSTNPSTSHTQLEVLLSDGGRDAACCKEKLSAVYHAFGILCEDLASARFQYCKERKTREAVPIIVTRTFVGEAAHTETVVEVTEEVVLVGRILVAKVVNRPEEVVMTAGFRA
jgi:hypothetical protein